MAVVVLGIVLSVGLQFFYEYQYRMTPDSSQVLSKKFDFSYNGKAYSLNVEVSKKDYDYYNMKGRFLDYSMNSRKYSKFTSPPDPAVEDLHDQIEALAKERGLDEFQKLELTISFIQSLGFDKGLGDSPKFPINSLVDGKGESEDAAIIAASIYKSMGINTAMITMANHMAVGLDIDESGIPDRFNDSIKPIKYRKIDYYYGETTEASQPFGSVPEELKVEKKRVVPIK